MVGSKVRALSNRYSRLERRDLRLIEYRFHVCSKENGVRKLFYNFEGDPWSDQKLESFRTGTLVWSSETSALPSSDSTSIPRKPASRNSCKNLMAINGRIKSYGPFEPVLWYGATRPPLHRVAIPRLLQGNLRPETPVKI
jgi:hypothetical protein